MRVMACVRVLIMDGHSLRRCTPVLRVSRFRRARRVCGVRSRRATRAWIVSRVILRQAGKTRRVRRVRGGLILG